MPRGAAPAFGAVLLLALMGLPAAADVPPPRYSLQVRVRDPGACDAKAISSALRAFTGNVERCTDGELGSLSAVLTLAPGQTTAVSKVRGTFEPAVQRCIARRALQRLHLPGQPACTPFVSLTLTRR